MSWLLEANGSCPPPRAENELECCLPQTHQATVQNKKITIQKQLQSGTQVIFLRGAARWATTISLMPSHYLFDFVTNFLLQTNHKKVNKVWQLENGFISNSELTVLLSLATQPSSVRESWSSSWHRKQKSSLGAANALISKYLHWYLFAYF